MVDLYYSIEKRKEIDEIDDQLWERISMLLDEIEMTYFINVGFPNDGDFFHDERDDKVGVSLATFLGYFGNARLCYEEQTLDRFVRYCKPYDKNIKEIYGFTVDEALKFVLHVRQLNNKKFTDIVMKSGKPFSYYIQNPEEWSKLTRIFIERGVTNPRDWIYEPELSGLLETYKTNPGEVNRHSKDELLSVDLDSDVKQNILSFLEYDKDVLKGTTIYYADKHYSEEHPIIKLGDDYICPINKFLLEALYYRINASLQEDAVIGVKYKQNKDIAFEGKVLEVFRDFFPPKTKIFINYSVDGIAENDMLIIYNDTCIVVEIKDCGFRAPFRDPIKAYDRIKKDYKSAIQLGYDQCVRVEDILLSGNNVEIIDANDKKKVLYRLNSNKIQEVWSIVVTDFNYGMIQTNLGSLLSKKDDALYPWSVCIDDLETLLLTMKILLKGIAPDRFIEFLDYRERYHEHIACFDELEICGWYLCDRKQFMEYADEESQLVNTTPTMGEIFDALYHAGLGFKNEFDMDVKKHYKRLKYPKSFEMSIMTEDTIKR